MTPEQEYPRKFETSKLDENQKSMLTAFFARRESFDSFLAANNIKLFTCPGCGYPTLAGRGGYEICIVCNWEDDFQDDPKADEIWGGPNSNLSLTENRLIIGKELSEAAAGLGGGINEDPREVLAILAGYDTKKTDLLNNISDDAYRNHPGFILNDQLSIDIVKDLIVK